jgi:predicted nucleotidyltransferase
MAYPRKDTAADVEACRRHRVSRAALFGSSTQVDAAVEPRDVDILVTFESIPPGMRAGEHAALLEELEGILGMPIDLVVSTAVRNPYPKDEIGRTEVVLYEIA